MQYIDVVFSCIFGAVLYSVIHIPRWLWIWILAIAMIKIVNIISGFVCKRRLMVEHTIMNKITGFLLFALPLTLVFIELKYSVVIVCLIATFAAIQEGHLIRTGREIL